MHKLTQTQYYQQLNDSRDTAISIRRSDCEFIEGQEVQGNHHRLMVDCQTFANNQNYLHENLIKLADGTTLDLNIETQLKTDLDNLKAELIAKDWVSGSQLLVDYVAWQTSQQTL
jgi:hypothetical protein